MLFTLLACIYITIICFVWGVFVYRLMAVTAKNIASYPHFSMICLIGFAAITSIAGIFSLFIPLGGWQGQLIVLIPFLFFLLSSNKKFIIEKIKSDISRLKFPALLLFIVYFLLLLVMSSWKIVHPDTLNYHAQTIQWIEKYKAIPGIVHLHSRFGYQGLWFTACALFSFKFIGGNATTFINTAVLIWYILFIVYKINICLAQKENYFNGFLWLSLLGISSWSYTEVRLTATSASPDFIAALFILAIVYLLLHKKESEKNDWLLISFLSLTAITIKLAALPVIIISVIAAITFLIEKKIKSFILLLTISACTLLPFVARNIISTGYVVFPSTTLDIVKVDWKYNQQLTNLEKDYIKAYARTEADRSGEAIASSVNMKITEWFPIWWRHRAIADKTILIVFVFSFIISLIRIKKIISTDINIKIAFLIMLAGIIFWFINAPDPRFGTGFLMGFIAIVCTVFLAATRMNKLIFLLILAAIIITISGYTVYRFKYFYNETQWLKPQGIEKTSYTTIVCNKIKINQPGVNIPFGNIPVPCTDDSCEHFNLRSDKITDGFRAKLHR